MRTKRPIKTKYKNLKGIIIPQNTKESLALLTPQGNVIPIIPNDKFHFLQNLIWESVYIFGKMIKKNSKESLEVVFFSSPSPPNLLLDMDLDSPDRKTLEHESTCA